ncbi:MAG: TonB-dependent receptor [Hymenobacteraceae bacterium]|nr:TonB-dependent receptor [Hymenobacteraceae bacterium]
MLSFVARWWIGLAAGVVVGVGGLLGPAQAQTVVPRVVRGFVTDAATAQPLPGAVVHLRATPTTGTVTDGNGAFQLPLPTATTGPLVIELLGYRPTTAPLTGESLRIQLTALAVRLTGATVVGSAGQANPEQHLRGAQMGEAVLTIETLRTLPVLFGEADPVKTLALLPGVQTGGEGQTGLYVRGGGQDQNLTLLDGAPIYNAGHLLNFFSVFNADALRSAMLLKTPDAGRGGRLSSVLDLTSRAGDPDSLRGRIGVGVIASRLLLEGPIGRRQPTADSLDVRRGAGGAARPTFLLAARRTYVDVLARPFQKKADSGAPYYFYDLNGRLAWRPGARDRLDLTLYHGRDQGQFALGGGQFSARFGWGNSAGALRWQHTFRERLRLLTTLTAVDYQFQFTSAFSTYETRLLAYVRDYAATTALQWEPVARHRLEAGLTATRHTLRPRAGDASTADGQQFTTNRVQTKYADEAAAWVQDEWSLTDAFQLSAGLRWSGLRQRGPFTDYEFTGSAAQVLDSVFTPRGATVVRFQTPEPRVAVRWALPGGRASLKAAYARSAQYVHLVSQATSALPLDVWVPASRLAPPQRAHGFSAGYFRTLGPAQAWEVSVEAYYRRLSGQLEYRDGYVAGPSNRDIEFEFVRGTGRAYGLELLARRTTGRTRGWLAYTLARATRAFPDLNGGRTFPFRFDQRHNLSLVATYDLTPRWLLGSTFTYATGQALTMPERRYVVAGNVQFQYGARNAFRMPPNHRLDFAATWQRPPHRLGPRVWRTRWQFSVYNVYGRRNPWFYYLAPTGDATTGTGRLTGQSVALFPIPLPAVTWEIEF